MDRGKGKWNALLRAHKGNMQRTLVTDPITGHYYWSLIKSLFTEPAGYWPSSMGTKPSSLVAIPSSLATTSIGHWSLTLQYPPLHPLPTPTHPHTHTHTHTYTYTQHARARARTPLQWHLRDDLDGIFWPVP